MFSIDPSTLSDTRIQLHWASQLLSAEADAKLEKAADDSHSNVGWDAGTGTLVGRGGSSINVPEFEVIDPSGQHYSLTGKTLADALAWLSGQLKTELKLRDYELPEHAVSSGSGFSPDSMYLEELARWFTLGQRSMQQLGSTRLWPHHFDMGFLFEIEGPNRSIGGGLSLGDHHFDLPYFYLSPYGVDRPESLPELAAGGFWSDQWFGAILTAEKLVVSNDPNTVAKEFLDSTFSICGNFFAIHQ